MAFLKIPGRDFRKKKNLVVTPSLAVPLVKSTKQRKGLEEEKAAELKKMRTDSGVVEGKLLPQVMGGGPLEFGGDGTGWAGGITLDYWVARLKNLAELSGWLGRKAESGRDYPNEAQMEQARKFAKSRESM